MIIDMHRDSILQIDSSRGRLFVAHSVSYVGDSSPIGVPPYGLELRRHVDMRDLSFVRQDGADWFFWVGGFGFISGEPTSRLDALRSSNMMSNNMWGIIIPWWFVSTVFATATAALTAAIYRNEIQIGEGLCPYCRYDVRYSSDRCPECGTNLVEERKRERKR